MFFPVLISVRDKSKWKSVFKCLTFIFCDLYNSDSQHPQITTIYQSNFFQITVCEPSSSCHLNPWKSFILVIPWLKGFLKVSSFLLIISFLPRSKLYVERTSNSSTKPGSFSRAEKLQQTGGKSLKLYEPVSSSAKMGIVLLKNKWMPPNKRALFKFGYSCEGLLLNLE